MRKTWLLYAFAMGVCIFYTLPAMAENNLIKNGSFEEVEDGKPAYWQTAAWINEKEVTEFVTEWNYALEGKKCASIFSRNANHARYLQNVSVEENSLYRLSCHIRTENVSRENSSKGANINIETRIETSQQLFETTDAWQPVELYVQTGKGIQEVTVALALGGYYGDASGMASFDRVTMVKLDNTAAQALPPGASLCTIGEVTAAPVQAQKQPEKKSAPMDSRIVMYLLFLFIILFLLSRVVYYNRKQLAGLLQAAFKKRSKPQPKNMTREMELDNSTDNQ